MKRLLFIFTFVFCVSQFVGAQEYRNLDGMEFLVLSSPESANCYIVSRSGCFMFATVKGNSSESVGRVSSVAVLWESFGTMMDRNLGATSATPGDVGALGLLYQWGRKDPFLGSSSISSNTLAKSTKTWPSSVDSDSSTGTIAYATARPTTFITYNFSNYDWYYTGDSSTDNTRWTTSERNKSIYDPCPAGWRVPDGGSNGVWSKALGSSSNFYDYPYDSTNEGMNFSGTFGSASTIWYLASGFRNSDDGSLSYVGYLGSYWSASPYNSNAYGLFFSSGRSVFPLNDFIRAYGHSVRCLQE